MKKSIYVAVCCLLVCLGAYRWGGASFEQAKTAAMSQLYKDITQMMLPQIYLYDKTGCELLQQDVGAVMLPVLGSYNLSVDSSGQGMTPGEKDGLHGGNGEGEGNSGSTNDGDGSADGESGEDGHGGSGNASQGDGNGDDGNASGDTNEGNENANGEGAQDGSGNTDGDGEDDTETVATGPFTPQREIDLRKLQDFDYLRQNFYQIDTSTTITSALLNADKLLKKDLTLNQETKGPKILIYHTHSQEEYKDTAGDSGKTVVGVGDYLAKLLTEEYGIEVLHHKGVYDMPSRTKAYSNALPNIRKILEENPSIEVVIDLHRDGVPDSAHLVSEIGGKKMAKLMFFNGLSRTTSVGELKYLPNPYIEDNLAFSLRMQLEAAEYFPGLTRRIYLKGYRYNMHLCPKSMLVEVGAQTNTFEEAKNSMEPLAFLLSQVLKQ